MITKITNMDTVMEYTVLNIFIHQMPVLKKWCKVCLPKVTQGHDRTRGRNCKVDDEDNSYVAQFVL